MLRCLMWILAGVQIMSCHPPQESTLHCSTKDSAHYHVSFLVENQQSGHSDANSRSKKLEMEWLVCGQNKGSKGEYVFNIFPKFARIINTTDTTFLSFSPNQSFRYSILKAGSLQNHELSKFILENGHPELSEVLEYFPLFSPIDLESERKQILNHSYAISGMESNCAETLSVLSSSQDSISYHQKREIIEMKAGGDWDVSYTINTQGSRLIARKTGWPYRLEWQETGKIIVGVQPKPVSVNRRLHCIYRRL